LTLDHSKVNSHVAFAARGSYEHSFAIERTQDTGCSAMRGVHLIDGAGSRRSQTTSTGCYWDSWKPRENNGSYSLSNLCISNDSSTGV
jgi:hypothetical protein